MTMTPEERLAVAEDHYQRLAESAEIARLKRNDRIREALADGMTHAQIARATGMTRGRVGQIAMALKETTA